MMLRRLIILFLLLDSAVLLGQVYRIDQSTPVAEDGRTLDFPWSGGLNAGQYNTLDVDLDGLQDLIIFDRTAGKINVFRNTGSSYEANYEYISQFPDDLRNWVLFRDYDCDGRKDLFASDPLGIRVYKNISDSEGLKWRLFNNRGPQSPLLTKGFSNNINLQINATDIPSITDIDGDGDLDILNFRFTGASTVEFHKNLSIERTGACDSLQLERVTQSWGEFEQCLCEDIAFSGDDCSTTGGRTKHQGGKALLTLDTDGDGDHEAVISEETCTGLYFLENEGSSENELFQSVSTSFPSISDPGNLFVFPAAFYEDVDFDGIQDMIIAPNVSSNVNFGINFRQSSWYYRNVGTAAAPNFQLQQRNFLQDNMIEVGENAVPAFFDYDADGDLDMFVGQFVELGGVFRGTIKLYRNIGDSANPNFELDNSDFFLLSTLGLINIKPAFEDVDNNGTMDLVLSSSSPNSGATTITYFENSRAFGLELNGQPKTLFNLANNISFENFKLYDINSDGLKDLLVGRSTGQLQYYRNIGTVEAPDFFLEDEDFLGISISPFTVNSSVDIGDMDGDGLPDLVVGDARGNLTYYSDFRTDLTSDPEDERLLFETSTDSAPDFVNLGSQLVPRIVNLFNEDKPALAVGTGQGGIHILRNTGAEANPAPELVVGVFPNPAVNRDLINFRTPQRTFAYIVSLKGQRLTDPIIMEVGIDNRIDISYLSEGLYILVTTPDGSNFTSYRFMVDR